MSCTIDHKTQAKVELLLVSQSLGLLPLLCGHGEGLLVLCLVLSDLAGSWPYLALLVPKLWVAFDPLFWSDWEALRGLWRKFDSCGVVCIIYQPW